MRRQGRGPAAIAALVAALTCCANAAATPPVPPETGFASPGSSEVQHLHFKYGPIEITPGDNLILLGPATIEKPAYDGYMTSFSPNLVRADGSVPNVDVIHLHHGVWANASRKDWASPGLPERFAAAGEEKTVVSAPPGYGYPVKASDVWIVNYMIHNQTPQPETVWLTYDMDYVPADSELARHMTPVRPLWLDVENGKTYPVFDVHRGSGGADGRVNYPFDFSNPYGDGRPRNEWKADRDITLVGAAGHVHPGGLWTDLDVVRPGAKVKRKVRRCRRVRTRRRCRRVTRVVGRDRVRAFRSNARYFDERGPISWDLAMEVTRPDWRVGVRKGDTLRVSAVYDTERASWYESMGIVVTFATEGNRGPDPFATKVDTKGAPTHGHLKENENHGGAENGAPDPTKLPDGGTLNDEVGIFGFTYTPGNIGAPGVFGQPPVIQQGKPLTFENPDATAQVFHTITACKPPCNRSTGISYPLADGDVDFDSGELGYGPTGFSAAANRHKWSTPTDLKPGTYTYFCRVHPYMRGAFRVKGKG